MKWLVWPLAMTLAISSLDESLEAKSPAENTEAQTQTSEQKKAAKIKAEVAKRALGERVRVKFRDGHELKGHITRIEDDSFELQIDPDKLDSLPGKQPPIKISYADIAKIRGAQTRAAKIGVNVGEAVLFVAIVAVLIFLAIVKYQQEHDY